MSVAWGWNIAADDVHACAAVVVTLGVGARSVASIFSEYDVPGAEEFEPAAHRMDAPAEQRGIAVEIVQVVEVRPLKRRQHLGIILVQRAAAEHLQAGRLCGQPGSRVGVHMDEVDGLVPAAGEGALLRLIDRSAIHAAEKLRVDFVANASHELRTPLTVVLGYAESLEDGDLDSELTVKFAQTIRSEARRMLRIIEDLMSLSRIEADRFVAPTDSVSIETVIRSAVETVRSFAQQRGCSIRVEIQDDLPPVQGDLSQLVQVMDNLLSNSVRYGCAVPDCRIRVSAALDRQGVRVEVSDTGPGIPRQHLPFLTRRFYRVDPARSRETGGTGLGLAIVKHIVERHRGTLSIDSDLGKGTTVTILLPLGH